MGRRFREHAYSSFVFNHASPGGRCDCDAGGNVCMRGLDIFSDDPTIGYGANQTDTYVLVSHHLLKRRADE